MGCYVKNDKHGFRKISDPDIHLEKGMRAGISYASKRYSKANNKFYPNYDKEKQLKILSIYKILI